MKMKTMTKTATKGKGTHMKLTPLAKRGKKSLPRPGEYKYSKLHDLLSTPKQRIYVYSVIFACSAPYYNEDLNKYVVTAKLIDETLCPEVKSKGGQKFMQATIYAGLEKDVPQPTKIGSILRLHRGDTREYHDVMQVNCDVNIKGAWVLFDPVESDSPLEHTGRQFTFIPTDSVRLSNIRKFAHSFFLSHDELGGTSLAEAEKNRAKDFDVLCMVLDVKQKEAERRIRVCDGERVAKIVIKDNRLPHVSPLGVVHIRSVGYASEAGKILTINPYSNILLVPKEYMSAKKLSAKLKQASSNEIQSELKLYKPSTKDRVACSKVLGHKQAAPVPLKSIISGEGTKKGQHEYRVKVSLVQAGPKTPKDWLRVLDNRTQKTSLASEVLEKKATLPKDHEYCWQLRLFVKDETDPKDTNIYILFLNTIQGKGKEFFSFDLGRKAPTEAFYAELKRTYKMLLRSWAYLDLMVEGTEVARQVMLSVVDSVLTL